MKLFKLIRCLLTNHKGMFKAPCYFIAVEIDRKLDYWAHLNFCTRCENMFTELVPARSGDDYTISTEYVE